MPRPNYTLIAELERSLLGIALSSDTFAAASLAFRRAGMCLSHQPVADVSDIPVQVARCAQCDQTMRLGKSGEWEVLRSTPAGSPACLGFGPSAPFLLGAGERVLPIRW